MKLTDYIDPDEGRDDEVTAAEAAYERCRWLRVSRTPSRLNRSRLQNSTKSNFRLLASSNRRWNCSPWLCLPVARSTYSWTIVHFWAWANSRSWASWFSVSC